MSTRSKKLLACCGAVMAAALVMAAMPGTAAADPPKNVIVMISDGCGYNHIAATNYYQYGTHPAQGYESWPYQAGMSTYAGDGNGYFPQTAWSDFNYVNLHYTDSAAAATAMSCGVKTYGGAIGMDMDQQPLEHIADRLKDLGKATGVVSSVEFSHATPAGYVAHNVSRNNYSEIAQEMLCDSRTDVIMGCGNPWFDADGNLLTQPNTFNYVGGQYVWESLEAGLVNIVIDEYGNTNPVEDCNGDGNPDAWTLIQTREEFQNMMTGDTPVRVCGVPQCYKTLQHDRSGDYYADPYVAPLTETVPTLEEMTRAALNVLDNDADGLFLMVEGGAVDWASHGNASERVIEEEIDFNNSVQAVVDWVNTYSNWDETLVIVTGDHECGYLCGPGSDPDWMPIVNNGAGNLPGMEWHSGSHTNPLIPIFANGVAAEGLVPYTDEYDPERGLFVNNTELAQFLFELYPAESIDEPEVIIVMISDGCGYNHIEGTDYYQYGAAGTQVYESWPVQCALSTWSGSGNGYGTISCWNDFSYVMDYYTDSAAAATAMSCGIKTYDAAIGVDMDEQPLLHIADRAEDIGKSSGVVSSVEFSHATPAGFAAHNVSRNNYAEIAQEMLLDTRLDVIAGCGNPWYDGDGNLLTTPGDTRYIGGDTMYEEFLEGNCGYDTDGDDIDDNWCEDSGHPGVADGIRDPWTFVTAREDVQALATGPAPKRLFILPEVYKTLQHDRGGDYYADPYVVPLTETVCTLEEMTKAALNVLDDNPNGFFLMVEGGAIDWAAHGNASGRMIEEEIDFNRSVEAVVDWIETNGTFTWDDVLVVVTGDHECGYLCGPGSDPDWMPIVNNGAGNLPGMEWHSGSHTNALIPFFAEGAGAEVFLGYTEEWDSERNLVLNNTELAQACFRLWPDAAFGPGNMSSVEGGESVVSRLPRPIFQNPYRVRNAISYAVPQTAPVSLAIYGIDGRKVATLFEGVQNAGTHMARWDAEGVAAGVYFARLEVAGESSTRKLVLSR